MRNPSPCFVTVVGQFGKIFARQPVAAPEAVLIMSPQRAWIDNFGQMHRTTGGHVPREASTLLAWLTEPGAEAPAFAEILRPGATTPEPVSASLVCDATRVVLLLPRGATGRRAVA